MHKRLAAEHIPADPATFWSALCEQYGAREVQKRGYRARLPAARADIMLAIARSLGGPDATCVEPGCGSGYLTAELATMFGQVDAFDSCVAMIEAADRSAENVVYFVADADVWQPERRYTVTFLSEILEHVRDPLALVRRYAAVSDYLVASAPLDETLADEEAFDVEAYASTREFGPGEGHISAWDWQGFAVMFAKYSWLCQARFARYGIAAVVTGA